MMLNELISGMKMAVIMAHWSSRQRLLLAVVAVSAVVDVVAYVRGIRPQDMAVENSTTSVMTINTIRAITFVMLLTTYCLFLEV